MEGWHSRIEEQLEHGHKSTEQTEKENATQKKGEDVLTLNPKVYCPTTTKGLN